MALWFYAFLVLWLYGFMVLWFYSCMFLWFYGFMVVWLYGVMVSGFHFLTKCSISCFQEDIDPISKIFKILFNGSPSCFGARLLGNCQQ